MQTTWQNITLLKLKRLAIEIASLLCSQSIKIIRIEGEMGAGKTTFISLLCKALGSTDMVNSPTFTIVNTYTSAVGGLHHFDFYRLKHPSEALHIGLEEYLYSNNYCFLEWSENVSIYLKNIPTITIHIYKTNDKQRTIKLLINEVT